MTQRFFDFKQDVDPTFLANSSVDLNTGFMTFYWADWFQLLSDEPNTAYSNRLLYVVFIKCWANRLLYVVLAGDLDTGS